MKFFDELGAMVAAQWKQCDYDERRFPQAAMAALADLPPSRYTNFEEVVEDALISDPMMFQIDLDAKFGQPPLTIYWGRDFRIEILFWTGAVPNVHQHAFSGAFHVMHGSSLHLAWGFKCAERVSNHLSYGSTHLNKAEILKVGDTREIVAGPHFIHTTFHLDAPTVSIVVRTTSEADQMPQYAYLPPAIAYNPENNIAALKRREQVLAMLVSAERLADYRARLRLVLKGCDTFSAFHYLLQASALVKENESLLELLREATIWHPKLLQYLMPSLEHYRRQWEILRLRDKISDVEARFVLALLANISDRTTLLTLINMRYPDEDPVEKFTACIKHISNQGHLGIELMLGCLLRGFCAPDEIKSAFVNNYGHEQVEQQADKITKLSKVVRRLWLLKPVLEETVAVP
jgi:hypothetical protein